MHPRIPCPQPPGAMVVHGSNYTGQRLHGRRMPQTHNQIAKPWALVSSSATQNLPIYPPPFVIPPP